MTQENGSKALPSVNLKVKATRFATKRTATFSKKWMTLSMPLRKHTPADAKKNLRKVRIVFLNNKN